MHSPVGLGNVEAAAHPVCRLLPLVLTSGPSLSGCLRSGTPAHVPVSTSHLLGLPFSHACSRKWLPSSPLTSAASDQKHRHTFALGSQPSSHQPCHGLPHPGGARPLAEMVVAVCGLLSWLGLQEVSQSSWPQRPSLQEGGTHLIFQQLPCV